MLTTVLPLITALGFGTLIGAFFQVRFEQRKLLNQQEHELKRKRYLCMLMLMLTKLEPASGLRHLSEHRPDLQDISDLDAELRTELLNAVLFASDSVIMAFSDFIGDPNHTTYVQAALAMRKDLWNKKTTMDKLWSSQLTATLSQSGKEIIDSKN